MKVFLGGTCNESQWRDDLIKHLKVEYFNPVVSDWNEQHQKEELYQCDICLYVITPKMTGMYAIAEVVDDANKRPDKTVFAILRHDNGQVFTDSQWKSLEAVLELCKRNGVTTFKNPTMLELAMYLNLR